MDEDSLNSIHCGQRPLLNGTELAKQTICDIKECLKIQDDGDLVFVLLKTGLLLSFKEQMTG